LTVNCNIAKKKLKSFQVTTKEGIQMSSKML
jgi:hypothetical protein